MIAIGEVCIFAEACFDFRSEMQGCRRFFHGIGEEQTVFRGVVGKERVNGLADAGKGARAGIFTPGADWPAAFAFGLGFGGFWGRVWH